MQKSENEFRGLIRIHTYEGIVLWYWNVGIPRPADMTAWCEDRNLYYYTADKAQYDALSAIAKAKELKRVGVVLDMV